MRLPAWMVSGRFSSALQFEHRIVRGIELNRQGQEIVEYADETLRENEDDTPYDPIRRPITEGFYLTSVITIQERHFPRPTLDFAFS